MAKKKKDVEKKIALQARKEAKQDKKAQKRILKQAEKGKDETENDVAAAIKAVSKNEEDELNALLEAYQKQSLALSTPIVEVLQENNGVPYPPRGNFTLTLAPTTNDIYMFGGEYFNGVENVVFDELYCWNPDAHRIHINEDDNDIPPSKNTFCKGIWKQITSPQPRPSPRCSHSSVFYNNAIYIFGGELANADNYHHFKDIWKFDLKTNLWTEIKPRNKGGPSPRSGHRALVWRNYMLIFGGFFEAVRETPRWFNDLHIFDFSTNTWIECAYSKLASIPPERSAFNFGLFAGNTDVAYVSGGYSKLKNPTPGSKAEGRVFNDCWALHLKGIESGKNPTWEKLTRKGEYPSQRSGTACTIWKNKMLVFGGVEDEENENHKINSVFFDDLFAFDMERRRWFRLNMKKKSGEQRRRRKKTEDVIETAQENEDDDDSDSFDDGFDGESKSNGWDIDKLRSNMFAFIDGDGNIVYERIEEDNEPDPKEEDMTPKNSEFSTEVDTGYDGDSGTEAKHNKIVQFTESDVSIRSEGLREKLISPGPAVKMPSVVNSEVMTVGADGNPEAVTRTTPLPRIKSQIVIRGNTLILYGGILEIGDREVTLDDIWQLDLQKREEWICISEGTMHKQVWKGATNDDDESYISTDRGTGGDESDDEGDFDELDDELEEDVDQQAAKAARKAAKKEKAKSIREEIKMLNEELGLGNEESTPKTGEELSEFYARTSLHWEKEAESFVESTSNKSAELSAKEIKREGFLLAQKRYEKLEPTLKRLAELEGMQMKIEQKKDREKKSAKKEKKKKEKDRRK